MTATEVWDVLNGLHQPATAWDVWRAAEGSSSGGIAGALHTLEVQGFVESIMGPPNNPQARVKKVKHYIAVKRPDQSAVDAKTKIRKLEKAPVDKNKQIEKLLSENRKMANNLAFDQGPLLGLAPALHNYCDRAGIQPMSNIKDRVQALTIKYEQSLLESKLLRLQLNAGESGGADSPIDSQVGRRNGGHPPISAQDTPGQ